MGRGKSRGWRFVSPRTVCCARRRLVPLITKRNPEWKTYEIDSDGKLIVPADDIQYGAPLVLDSVEYPQGIFAHAPSRLVYNLGSHSYMDCDWAIWGDPRLR